ncbi:RHS repeat-associated core domain-containing protein [Listeria cossartiae]|uniref:RHS repeat-associated core domain-containing protein n=1 Tax=Listeria cossartiae TaxID=2838249 RepID=UPI004068325C
MATTSDGETNTDYDYTDYGTALATAPVANQIGYRAQMHDTSDTQNLRARNYDTNTGRFQQADNYRGALDDPRSQNRYIYGANNPMSFGDPSGNIPKWLKKATKKAKKAVKTVSKGVKKVKNVVKKTVKKVKRVVKKVQKAIKKTIKKIKRVVKKVTKKVQKTVTKFKKAAKKSIKQVTKTAKKVYKTAKKVVQKKYNQVKQTVKKKVQTVKKAGKKVISKAKSAIKIISKETKKQVAKAANKLLEAQVNNAIRIEKTMKSICEGLSVIGAGVVDGFASDLTFGLIETVGKNKEVYGDDNRYYVGRLIADTVSVYFGVSAIIEGVAIGGAGLALDTTGIGALIGVPANVVGLTMVIGGTVLTASGAMNFGKDAMDLYSNFQKGNESKADISPWIKDNRVPLDKETILATFKKTKNRVKGATVYEKSGKFYHRDTLHKGGRAHLEVYDKKGKHLGEADPVTGEIIPNTADPTKRLPK